MMTEKVLGTLVIAALLAGCSGGSSRTTANLPQQQVFAVQSHSGAPGEEAGVTLRALPNAGAIVTIVGELDYDTSQLTMKSCQISPQIATGTTAGKTLHVAEPVPGTIRAVIEGGLQALPEGADVLSCSFNVSPSATQGETTVNIHGEVSDTTFVDRSFSTVSKVAIGN